MGPRRTLALFVLVGLVTAPAVAVSRCICRYSGQVMDRCETAATATVASPDCCDVVTRAPLGAAAMSDPSAARALASHANDFALAAPIDPVAPRVAFASSARADAPPESPPPLARTGILLI